MAGIAFRLQKLLQGDSYTDLIRAYLYSSIISTGPMLVIIFVLALLRTTLSTHVSIDETNLFFTLIVYVYAFSMIGISPFFYIITRYIADKYYLRQISDFSPCYFSSLFASFVIQSIFSILFLRSVELPFGLLVSIHLLYLSISGVWLAMIFLSAAQNYQWIVIAYFTGSFISAFLCPYWGVRIGLAGYIYGYSIGQFLIFAILSFRIVAEFGSPKSLDMNFFLYFKKYPYLALVGLFYYLGIWVDKFTFWYSDQGETVKGVFHSFPDYDVPLFLAFLTIVPSMAFFIIQMETSFYKKFTLFYKGIQKRDSLQKLTLLQTEIIETLTKNFKQFVVFQGIISGLIILSIYQIGDIFHLQTNQMGIFRIAILGAFMQMGFIMILNIIFYFDFQKEAFYLCFGYFLANFSFSFLSLKIGYAAYGYGFMLANLFILIPGFFILDKRLKNLIFWTFTRQAVLIPTFKLEKEFIDNKK